MGDIFLSYAREDTAAAERLAAALATQGWSVWWDRSIPPGQSFDRVIEDALSQARCVLVLWSHHALDSEWVRSEAEEARQRGVLVPVFIEQVVPPLAYRRIQAADLVSWDGAPDAPVLATLFAAVESLTGPLPQAATVEGRWEADVRYSWGVEVRERFEFRLHDDLLLGTAGFLGAPRGVLDGSVAGDRLRFRVRWEQFTGDEKLVVHNDYRGRLRDGKIDFVMQDDRGYPPVEFTATRVADATPLSVPGDAPPED